MKIAVKLTTSCSSCLNQVCWNRDTSKICRAGVVVVALRTKAAVSYVIVVCEEIKRGSCFKIFN